MNEDNFKKFTNLKELFDIVWNHKLLIATVTAVFALISVVISLTLPNIYTSQSLLAPTNSEESLSSKLSGYSSIANFAGVSIPGDVGSKSQEGIERIKSFDFFSKHFLPNVKLENILAVKRWSHSENLITYDKDLFDEKSGKWVRKAKYPNKVIPSDQEAYIAFKKMLKISEDKKTSFITVSIDHKSPIIAKLWLDIIFSEINESMRNEDAKKARESIAFLNESAQSTNIQSLKEATTKLLQDQMQTLMLVASNESYVFKIIDSPVVPEKKSRPSRALICIIGTLIGGILSLLIVFLRESNLFK